MSTANTVGGSRPEFRGLSYWMDRVPKELEAVRKSPDPDAVHDLRVAIRRCRSVAAVMEEVDPDSAWPDMRKLAKKVFHQLGELRDAQVLEEWTKKLGPESDPLREKLLAGFAAEEKHLEQAALKAVDKFDQKSWKKLERKLRRRRRLVIPDGLAAECLALERLEAAKELHVRALRAEKPEPWHALRIGVKRFRYALESLVPKRYAEWEEDLKHLQDLLGEVHDFDVLATKVAEIPGDFGESRAAWAERMASQRHQRIESYRALTVGEAGLWQHWRRQLPEGKRLATASQERLRVTARALELDTSRAMLVYRLSVRLFDSLAKLHVIPSSANYDQRRILRAAARLHSIGLGLDRKSPQRAARKYLNSLVLPPGWSEPEWDLMVNVVRYHRNDLPGVKHKSFTRFTPEEQKIIAILAGIVRLARALTKCQALTATGLCVEKSVDALILLVPGLEESEQHAARLAAGKYLLESSLGHSLIVRATQLMPKVVQLPRIEEPPASAAAASD
jgi:CHAD domain-containing protein